MKRRRWLIGTLCLAFALVGFQFLLPPLDEYAALDRVGKSMTASDFEVRGLSAKERSMAIESRRELDRLFEDPQPVTQVWVLTTAEPETADFLNRFASARRGWQRSGSGHSSGSNGKSSYRGISTAYENEDTGDRFEYEVKRFWPGNTVERTIHLSPSPSSRQLWPKIKRWVRLLLQP